MLLLKLLFIGIFVLRIPAIMRSGAIRCLLGGMDLKVDAARESARGR